MSAKHLGLNVTELINIWLYETHNGIHNNKKMSTFNAVLCAVCPSGVAVLVDLMMESGENIEGSPKITKCILREIYCWDLSLKTKMPIKSSNELISSLWSQLVWFKKLARRLTWLMSYSRIAII